MLSRTSEYALRAMAYLAGHPQDWPICGKDIAQATGVPRKYLSKILADLVRASLLESARGKSGGFNLVRPAHLTCLSDILSSFESFEPRCLPFITQNDIQSNPCQAHLDWQKIVDAEQQYLQTTTLQQITVTHPTCWKDPVKPDELTQE